MTLIVKFPSKSEVVPFVVPLTMTFAPGNGLPVLASVTVPVTVPCAKAKTGNIKIKKVNNLIKSCCFIISVLGLILTNL